MYAIIRTGGKQYKVQPGDVLQVEKLDQKLGSEFDVTEVILVGGEKTHLGQPLVQNAKVTVVVTKQARAPKVIVFKKKRRQGYRRTQGHRQHFTELFIKSITSPDGQVANSESQPKVVDAVAMRADRIKNRTKPTRKERAAGAVSADKKVAKTVKTTKTVKTAKPATVKAKTVKVAKTTTAKAKTTKTAKAKKSE